MCTDESFTLVQKGKYLLTKGTTIQIKSVRKTLKFTIKLDLLGY